MTKEIKHTIWGVGEHIGYIIIGFGLGLIFTMLSKIFC